SIRKVRFVKATAECPKSTENLSLLDVDQTDNAPSIYSASQPCIKPRQRESALIKVFHRLTFTEKLPYKVQIDAEMRAVISYRKTHKYINRQSSGTKTVSVTMHCTLIRSKNRTIPDVTSQDKPSSSTFLRHVKGAAQNQRAFRGSDDSGKTNREQTEQKSMHSLLAKRSYAEHLSKTAIYGPVMSIKIHIRITRSTYFCCPGAIAVVGTQRRRERLDSSFTPIGVHQQYTSLAMQEFGLRMSEISPTQSVNLMLKAKTDFAVCQLSEPRLYRSNLIGEHSLRALKEGLSCSTGLNSTLLTSNFEFGLGTINANSLETEMSEPLAVSIKPSFLLSSCFLQSKKLATACNSE
ncbi:hypothetical protein CLF_112482, partial [Clonorchis sinensis]